MTEFRVEHDSMGGVQVPADALWGAQTQRAVENFSAISDRPVPFIVIRELARIKGAAARDEVARARPVLRRLGMRDVAVVRAGDGKVDRAATVVRMVAGR